MNNKYQIKQNRRVVLTGIGPVTTIGIGKDSFFNNLYDQKYNIQPIPGIFEQCHQFKSRYYTSLPDIILKDHGINLHLAKIVHQKDALAILASKLALEDAGFNVRDKKHHVAVNGLKACGVILGTGISAFGPACDSYLAHLQNGHLCDYKDQRQSPRFNRMAIPMTMTNSPAAWTSIIFKLTGPSYTVNASCASGSYAIGEGFRQIREGRCQLVLAGGIEYLKDRFGYAMRGFDTLGTLTKSTDGLPRPFSIKRSGFLFSEGGACILVLEEYGHALKRNADIYAELIGFQANSDAYSIVQIDPHATQIQKLIKKTVGKTTIDYINTHGTATETNDQLEARVIQQLFGSKAHQPVMNSSKGILGHTIGAAGALEAAVTAMAIKYGKIHGNLTSDPIDNLNLPMETIEKDITHGLSLSFGFGGHNSCLVMKRI
jgi:3-oxoacyl-[acyl-carrier-protein] synthase II